MRSQVEIYINIYIEGNENKGQAFILVDFSRVILTLYCIHQEKLNVILNLYHPKQCEHFSRSLKQQHSLASDSRRPRDAMKHRNYTDDLMMTFSLTFFIPMQTNSICT